MDLDPLLLARLQFAFVVSFHILFPAFTIGLAAWLVVLEAAWLAPAASAMASCTDSGPRSLPSRSAWASCPGIVMSFQFGTNWSRFSDARRQRPRAAS